MARISVESITYKTKVIERSENNEFGGFSTGCSDRAYNCRIYRAGINRSACTKRSYTVGGRKEAYDPALDRKSTVEESKQLNLLNLIYLAIENRQYL